MVEEHPHVTLAAKVEHLEEVATAIQSDNDMLVARVTALEKTATAPASGTPEWHDISKWVVLLFANPKFFVVLLLILGNVGSFVNGHTWTDLVGNPANLVGLLYVIVQGIVDATPASVQKMRTFFSWRREE